MDVAAAVVLLTPLLFARAQEQDTKAHDHCIELLRQLQYDIDLNDVVPAGWHEAGCDTHMRQSGDVIELVSGKVEPAPIEDRTVDCRALLKQMDEGKPGSEFATWLDARWTALGCNARMMAGASEPKVTRLA